MTAYSSIERLAHDGAESRPRRAPPPVRALTATPSVLAGVIRNPRAHRNRRSVASPTPDGVLLSDAGSSDELDAALRSFAARGVARLVIDGGDGVVREVLTRLPAAFGARPPVIAVLPSGKTNALALDLGARPGWSLASALASPRTAERAPVEVSRVGEAGPPQRGFVFGAGAFVDVTALAQRLHRARMFDGLAVGAALGGAGARTLLGRGGGPWGAGVALRLQHGEAAAREGPGFLLLVSTLERLPLGLRPFGRPRPGLKVLDVEAPPRRLHAALPVLLSGRDRAWLAGAGYRRTDPDRLHVVLDGPYVLDGEVYPGGELMLSLGAPVTFVLP